VGRGDRGAIRGVWFAVSTASTDVGRYLPTAAEAANASTAATPNASPIPSTKAVRAASIRSLPRSAGRRSETCRADPTDASAAAANLAGRARVESCTEATYCEVAMLPRIATPSAPPSSLVVSFHAEPTPDFAGGTEAMINVVDGAIVRLMPSACTTSTTTSHP